MASSCRFTATSTRAGPLCAKASSNAGRICSGSSTCRPRTPAPLRNPSQVGVHEICSMIHKSRGLHLKFNKAEGAIVEHDNFDGKIQLPERKQITHQHGESPVAGKGNDLAVWMRDLCSNGLGQSVGHRSVIERTEQSPAAIHRQVARRPDHRCPDIHGKYCVVGRNLIENLGKVLRMDWALAPLARRKIVKTLACVSVVTEASIEISYGRSSARCGGVMQEVSPQCLRRLRGPDGCAVLTVPREDQSAGSAHSLDRTAGRENPFQASAEHRNSSSRDIPKRNRAARSCRHRRGLSYSMNSFPRMACTIGAWSFAANWISSS